MSDDLPMPSINLLASGPFDDIRFRQIRFLHAAWQLGKVHLLLWSDEMIRRILGKEPKFPLAERQYFLEAIRYVDRVTPVGDESALRRTMGSSQAEVCVVDPQDSIMLDLCQELKLTTRTISESELTTAPPSEYEGIRPPTPGRKKVVATGCFDWFHSGHVRFCEECHELGDLYLAVGNDANIRFLKGEGHPLFPQDQRRFIVGSIRYVHQALVGSGMGWMDAAEEFERIQPDIYVVNEDGDKPEKRAFCAQRGIEYRVLKRLPRPGLPRRSSTSLRGF